MGEIVNEWIYGKTHLSSPSCGRSNETDGIEAKLERSGIAGKDELGAGKREKRLPKELCERYRRGNIDGGFWVHGNIGRVVIGARFGHGMLTSEITARQRRLACL